MRLALATLLTLISTPSLAGDLEFGYIPMPEPGQKPAFMMTAAKSVRSCQVVIDAGDGSWKFTRTDVAPGTQMRFEWPRDPSVSAASAHILCEFTDESQVETIVPIEYSYAGKLEVDVSRAVADLERRVLTVSVSAVVDRLEITAYGAHKAVLDESIVELGAGPGEIEVPWIGDPSDVVLLEIKAHSGNAWAGFTYSPWFLDIPHDDVLFESNQDVIRSAEEPKLQATLKELMDVLDKYGDIVPVKLYIAGCTDTVGNPAHNRDLSKRRARSIARWLRNHGYNRPIFYWGFGEALLAVSTGDGVDEERNRRALYMVGANPPPGGSGIPSVGWIPL
jgi:outer membrane protein OmpA-like peptidoglycan-associated protein